jgi:hypothetical protein
MTASSWLLAPLQRRCHLGKYRKDCSPNVIFLTFGPDRIGLRIVRDQHISNHVSRDRRDRYNLSDLFNLETKDF